MGSDYDDDDVKRIVLAAVDERDDTPTEPHRLRGPRGCLWRDGVVLVAGDTLSGARSGSSTATKDPADFALRRIYPPK